MRLLLMLVFAFAAAAANAAGVSATLDRDRIEFNESVELRIRAEGAANVAEPELGVLERDFELLSSSRNARISIVNGSTESYTEWIVNLSPKRTGDLVIPSITVGAEHTRALQLEVREDASPDATADRDIVLEATTDHDEVHVQQQLLLTVRLLHAVNLARGAQLEEPEIADAVVRKIGEGSYEKTIGTRRYGVYERRYAVFPQKSGTLRVPSLSFQASIGGGSWFDQFGAGARTLRLRSPERSIRVLPPEDGAAPWLPARTLSLIETWDRSPQELRVGDSATRTITITADGLTGAQLPPLPTPAIGGLRFYPDQPEISEETTAEGVQGTRIERSAVIPMRAGDIEFPELRLRWWDTINARFAEAVIPRRTIRVRPAAAGAASGAPVTSRAAPASPRAAPGDQPGSAAPAVALGERAGEATAAPAWEAATAVLALLALVSSLQWWRLARRERARGSRQRPEPDRAREKALFAELAAACRAGDALQAEALLLRWGRARFADHPPHSLAALARRIDSPDFDRELSSLLASRYAAHAGGAWQGDGLLALLQALPARPSGARGTDAGGLAPLYPPPRESRAPG